MSFAISFETHEKICEDLRKQIKDLIVENEQLRQALIRLREEQQTAKVETKEREWT